MQSPEISFRDPDLKSATAATNSLGLPQVFAGNFADVYELQSPGGERNWAVKCFTKKVTGLRERYREISRHLEQAHLPLTVGFEYLEEGIRIRGEWYPVLKMDWVSGFTLRDFVAQNLNKPRRLEVLLQVWLKVEPGLRQAQITHGDLQHGNILLVPGANERTLLLKLIDYDGLWVPALADQPPREAGHAAYQHPRRVKENLYTSDLDRFPHLVIACALRCLSGPDAARLWKTYDTGDNLLFTQTDFERPAESKLLRELWTSANPERHAWAGHLAVASQFPLEATPLLSQLYDNGRLPPLNPIQEESATDVFSSPTPSVVPPPNREALATPAPVPANTLPLVATQPPPLPGALPQPSRISQWWSHWGSVSIASTIACVIVVATTWNLFKDRLTRPPTAPPQAAKAPPSVPPKTAQQIPSPKPPLQIRTSGPRPALLKAGFTLPQAQAAQQAWASHLNEPVELATSIDLGLVLIPPGQFVMGSPQDEGGRIPNESQVGVELSQPFWLGKHEVTQAQWQKVVQTAPWNGFARREGPEYPVLGVTWDDAAEFCRKFTELERRAGRLPIGWEYALPTEAQWEYACRAGTTTPHNFEGDPAELESHAWNGKSTSQRNEPFAHPVGIMRANAWGLHDMLGNVEEWCQDFYWENPLSTADANPQPGQARVCRGGCWHTPADFCRSAFRRGESPLSRSYSLGFRIARVSVNQTQQTPLASLIPNSTTPKPDPAPPLVPPPALTPAPPVPSPTVTTTSPKPASLKAPFTPEQAKTARTEWAAHLGEPAFLTNSIEMKLVLIPPGDFTMGSQPSERAGENSKNERARAAREEQVAVTLSQPFWMGKYEVTLAEWVKVMGKTPSPNRRNTRMEQLQPAVVKWQEAVEFCQKLTESEIRSKRLPEGGKYTLPTEAQWEYACRAGTTTRYSFGDDDSQLDAFAWFAANSEKTRQASPHDVGKKQPNAWDLYDMHGNVFEWCQDFYAEKLPGGHDPLVDSGSKQHAYRGGCWRYNLSYCRSAYRSENYSLSDIGFRIVRVPPLAPQPKPTPTPTAP